MAALPCVLHVKTFVNAAATKHYVKTAYRGEFCALNENFSIGETFYTRCGYTHTHRLESTTTPI